MGASSLFLAAAAKEINGTVFCIDTWYNETMTEGVRDTFIEFNQNTKDFETIIIPCRGKSKDVVKTF